MPYQKDMKAKTSTSAHVEARLPNEVLARLQRASDIQCRTLTDFIVSAAVFRCGASGKSPRPS
jgi:uncharacterized protein (DUF1778 family)